MKKETSPFSAEDRQRLVFNTFGGVTKHAPFLFFMPETVDSGLLKECIELQIEELEVLEVFVQFLFVIIASHLTGHLPGLCIQRHIEWLSQTRDTCRIRWSS